MKKKLILTMVLLALLLTLTAQDNPEYSPGDQSLMLVPTAYTMPAGSHAITDYEVFFVQYAHSFFGNTHLSIMSMLPFTKEFHKTITLGAKHRYLANGIVQSAAFGSFIPDNGTFVVGNVVSIGQPSTSLHLGLGYGWEKGEGFDAPIIYLGARNNVSKKVAFMLEYGSSLIPTDGDLDSLVSFGVRFIGNTISWDLGGFRPIGVDLGNAYFIPVLKATFEF
ncbi:MAG: hypothetical protein RBR69_10595 [Candidatus Cloacimonadaceae bacterium]|jgi:hypothetical protein|nr:hypothetical protein [Candidatus Cloacimonadota bacterium]MDY0128569.1 hypothetical protein [Candidatus Cloacimonadaceae bacterium]MCB5254060.1 hypothetical protein [Candidatus Cloacimonadota bacterium]MCK9178717.1 hypothetical protein [Candidatus Cloacimonadota bacterium]MCK9242863.1 hypothetical protein [Candidatus Cloacimonadota bacterium]